MTDRSLERDAERWRKLVALLQQAYDEEDVETDDLFIRANMLSGRGACRRIEVSLSFADRRDEPLDLATAVDAAPWPQMSDEDGISPDADVSRLK